ncbi:hypothetical protein EU805_08015 [Salipiger sp. IMCC34102]|uniref:hypothetical protein n=1 Tax=Salipiger sp. IMCC34102 TaxID=2510647 RepID=UPI00101C373F|nr:hypothetical protein [Salipiger sp. IMCC34102]RYH02559.1 hypothetical protein EU805_08015 [Salipiger sp. IMCC34102]
MLDIILIVGLVILLASVLIAALRRFDANSYFDQDRQPFYSEPDELVKAGLIFSQRDRSGEEKHTYTVTPAGEAGLRAWLREPTNDPGFLSAHFGGLVKTFDADQIVDGRTSQHRSRLAEYERIEELVVNRPEWRYALAATRVGIEFERACLEFWDEIATDQKINAERAETQKEKYFKEIAT